MPLTKSEESYEIRELPRLCVRASVTMLALKFWGGRHSAGDNPGAQ